jgi:signal transduction histidine kinase
VRAIDTDAVPSSGFGAPVTGVVNRYHHTTVAMLHITVAADLAVRGDATRLQQVITNLLDNALRHGGEPVTVTAALTTNLIILTVHDEGPGMDRQFLPHATERFSRADTARPSPGTGLGLSLVEAIVRAHHGELHLLGRSASPHRHRGGRVRVAGRRAAPARRHGRAADRGGARGGRAWSRPGGPRRGRGRGARSPAGADRGTRPHQKPRENLSNVLVLRFGVAR